MSFDDLCSLARCASQSPVRSSSLVRGRVSTRSAFILLYVGRMDTSGAISNQTQWDAMSSLGKSTTVSQHTPLLRKLVSEGRSRKSFSIKTAVGSKSSRIVSRESSSRTKRKLTVSACKTPDLASSSLDCIYQTLACSLIA